MTIAEELIRKGRQEGLQAGLQAGRQEGLQDGIARGRTEGRRETLRKLLELKFGPISAELVAVVQSAEAPELERYLERVLTADSPDAVFGA